MMPKEQPRDVPDAGQRKEDADLFQEWFIPVFGHGLIDCKD